MWHKANGAQSQIQSLCNEIPSWIFGLTLFSTVLRDVTAVC